MDTLLKKEQELRRIIRDCESLVIGFSGGVDSTLLALIGVQELQENCLLVTYQEAFHSSEETEESKELAKKIGGRHILRHAGLIDAEFMKQNPQDRCYYCKRAVFSGLMEIREEYGMRYVADGSNVDDLSDYRPGLRALKELSIRSPLREAGLTKQEIRELSRKYDLPTWSKPAFACLASRIPYGEAVTEEKCRQIEEGERFLREHGFIQYRLRHHGELARIEVEPSERHKLFDEDLLDALDAHMKKLGFRYVAIEAAGYRMGNMNQGVKNG